MNHIKSYTIIIAVLVFLIISCKNDSQDFQFPDEFQGVLWEYAEDDSSEFFIEFTDNEVEFTSKFDFEDCYFISSAQLIDIDSNGKFFIEEVEDGEIQGSSAYIKREGKELWVSGVRTYQTKEIYKQSTRSKSTFQPICSE